MATSSTLKVGTNETYKTIQAAIDKANAGDTIQVDSGTYAENLNINKSVNIIGANSGISGTATRNTESSIQGTIVITAPNATLNGFSISTPAASATGIDIQGAAGTSIVDSILTDPDGNAYGVQTNASGLKFQNNLVTGYNAGLYVNGPATGDISVNRFVNNGSAAVLDTSGVKFHDNVLTGSGGTDIGNDVGRGFATTNGDNDDLSTYIYNNTYTVRTNSNDRNISIEPQEDGITVTGTSANDRLRDDAVGGHTGVTFIGGAGLDSINATFRDLNTDTFGDIQSGEYITVNDRGDVTATLSNGQLTLQSGTQRSIVNLPGANGSVAVTSDGTTSTVTYTAAAVTPPSGGGSTPAPTAPTSGDDNLVGTDGPDTISLGTGNDIYAGGAGNDVAYGNMGNDLIYGNQGDDIVYGGMDQDTAYGGQGQDVIYGNRGDDVVYGNRGDDKLFGGMGNDTTFGGMGNDTLVGGKGDDLLVGGLGSDTFGFNPGDTDFQSNVGTGDTIADFVSGTDKIDFTAGPAATAGNFGSGSVAGGSFAQLQAAAQQLITGGKTYVFETDGTNGYLFTSAGGPAGTIEDAVKLTGANTAASVKFTDIAGGAVA